MNKLIYYPSFEPQNMDWLKYALIYIDTFSPIIPDSGKDFLSDEFRMIKNETDLVEIITPGWEQGDRATAKVLKEIEHIEAYPDLFNNMLGMDIDEAWKNPHNWNHELFAEKFNGTFKNKCIEKGLGMESTRGIITSKELTQLYMTVLADDISIEKGGSPITDSRKYDQLSTYLRVKNHNEEEMLKYANIVIDISLPKNINKIDLKKFIEFRNDSGLNELRKSFNKSLVKFYKSMEENTYPYEYIESLKKTHADFFTEIGLFFGGTMSTLLGGSILLQNPDNDYLEIIKQIIEGTVLLVAGVTAINKSWVEDREKWQSRKFLNELSRIK